MKKLNNLFRWTKLLLQYWLHNSSNRERIFQTLQGDYKALHGIKGTIFLQGHMHSDPWLVDELGYQIFHWRKDDKQKAKDKITMIASNNQIKKSNIPYEQDIKIIKDLVGKQDIEAIYIETDGKTASELLSGISRRILIENLKYMWFSDDVIDDLELHQFDPVLYLWARWVLNGIKIIWMEWQARNELTTVKNQMNARLNMIKEKINKDLADNKPIADHIILVLDYVINGRRSFSDEWLQNYTYMLDSYLPKEIKDEALDLICSFRERFSEGSKQRESEMAKKVDSDNYKKAIIVVWNSHLQWLERLLWDYHIKKTIIKK